MLINSAPSAVVSGNTYRPEIDGLRAVAVVLVILFHAGYGWMPGGYVGVDVFFVISGYLITRLMLVQMHRGEFSFGHFYGRRIRRLVPALIVTVVLVFLASLFVLSIDDLKRLGLQGPTALFGVSNFYFSGRVGYFDDPDALYPLLHTWSLGVEEQFYLVAPFTTFLVLRYFGFRGIFLVSLVVMVASLAAAELLIDQQPRIAFYWPFFRIWEFVLGGLLVWCPDIRAKNRLFADLLTGLGLLLIVFSALTFNPESGLPGLPGLLPCVGAALVIATASSGGLGRVLANPVSVGLGLISYSLYLVHWPVMVFFAAARMSGTVQPDDRIWAILLTLALAILLFFLVERRFRARTGETRNYPAFAKKCGLVSGVCAATMITAWFSGGWSWHLKTKYLVGNEGYYPCKKIHECPIGAEGDPAVILTGDSHATHLTAGFHNWATREGKGALVLTAPSCNIPMATGVNEFKKPCEALSKVADRRFRQYPGVPLVVAQRWRGYPEQEKMLDALDRFLAAHSDRLVLVVGQMPQLPRATHRCGRHHSYILDESICETGAFDKIAPQTTMQVAQVVAKHPSARLIDPVKTFCKTDTCRTSIDNYRVYIDAHHISANAAEHLFDTALVQHLK